MLLNIYQWAKDSYEVTSSKGFSFSKDNYPALLKEIIGELFEADGHIAKVGDGAWFRNSDSCAYIKSKPIPMITNDEVESLMLDTVEFEVGDACLRILSFIGSINGVVDFSYSNTPVSDSFDSMLLRVARVVSCVECLDSVYMARGLVQALGIMVNWCRSESIDLEWVLKVKMNYNRTRPYLHKVS